MDAIDHFGAELSKQEITDQRRVKNLMINGIVRLAQEMGQNTDCARMGMEDVWWLTDCLCLWKEECRRIVNSYEESRNGHYSANIRKALAYIQEYYAKDLLVKKLLPISGRRLITSAVFSGQK